MFLTVDAMILCLHHKWWSWDAHPVISDSKADILIYREALALLYITKIYKLTKSRFFKFLLIA